ncbi:MAG: helix-turn-helix domain-containing protein [Oscillospiraceae bacterium]|jgi:transcriptional regulator with XRE-family HTH domain|nr:helix-turn-helix domain-containing protein [Oscillospiraceae bacterium]
MKPLHEFLRDIKEDHDMNQTQVAQALGISQSHYSRYERGENELPVRHLVGLARLYNVSTDYILQLTEYKHSLDTLMKPFIEGISIGKLLSNIVLLNNDRKKLLIKYINFLNNGDDDF